MQTGTKELKYVNNITYYTKKTPTSDHSVPGVGYIPTPTIISQG